MTLLNRLPLLALALFSVGCATMPMDDSKSGSLATSLVSPGPQRAQVDLTCSSAMPSGQSQPADFSGEWTSNWGPIWLLQSGSSVQGQYYVNRSGSLNGEVSGNVLEFSWREGRLSGSGSYTLCPDGMSFIGGWGSADNPMANAWNASRVGSPPPRRRAPMPVSEPAPGPSTASEPAPAPASTESPAPEPSAAPAAEPEKKTDPSWDSQLVP